MSVCIECGGWNDETLYKKYKGGAIQLNQCVHCHEFIDKYIEYDSVILLLDIMLFRIQSYLHVIFNYSIKTSLLCRLIVVLILSEAYIKLRLMELKSEDSILLQTHFHLALCQSVIEFMILLILTWSTLLLCNNKNLTLNHMFRIILIANFVKFCAVVAMIWVDEFYIQFLLFLSLPAHLQTYRALLSGHWIKSTAIVLAQTIFMTSTGNLMTIYRLLLYDFIK